MSESVIRNWTPSDAQRSDRSAGDRSRHRQKVQRAIRENIADIVAEESIIGQSRDRVVKVPIRGIKEYRFVFGPNSPGVAEGDGNSERGQQVSRDDSDGGPGRAGDQPGVDYYETDISLEELIEIMFEDLELPLQERKQLAQVEVQSKRRYAGYRKKDIRARLSLQQSAIQRVRRLQKTKRSIGELEQQIEQLHEAAKAAREQEDLDRGQLCSAEAAVKQTRLEELQELVRLRSDRDTLHQQQQQKPSDTVRFPFRHEDMRFHHRRETVRRESNALVICIMDTSGSMDMMKKYLARSFFFLLHSFVCTRYSNVELVFVAHHMDAREVTEEEFFHKGESGGTLVSSGYLRALDIIQERYHPSLWNIYAFHCSDGDNFPSDNDTTMAAASRLCEVCNLFGYGEIKPLGARSYDDSLLALFSAAIKSENFKSILIEKKEDVWPGFKSFLQPEKVAK